MTELSRLPKAKKNLRALLSLGFVLALVASIGGGFILVIGYFRAPTYARPFWEFGQWMLMHGVCTLFVFLCIFFQVRKLSTEPGQQHDKA